MGRPFNSGLVVPTGFFVGLFLFIVKKINPEVELQYQERFDPNPFFLLLLPPIIFESGYSLHKVYTQ